MRCAAAATRSRSSAPRSGSGQPSGGSAGDASRKDLLPEDRPEEAAISGAMLCGLHRGVLVATDEQRPGRLAPLVFAERHLAA